MKVHFFLLIKLVFMQLFNIWLLTNKSVVVILLPGMKIHWKDYGFLGRWTELFAELLGLGSSSMLQQGYSWEAGWDVLPSILHSWVRVQILAYGTKNVLEVPNDGANVNEKSIFLLFSI